MGRVPTIRLRLDQQICLKNFFCPTFSRFKNDNGKWILLGKQSRLAAKGLSATTMLIVQKVLEYANSRFTLKSWKSKGTDPKNPSSRKDFSKPKEQNQTQL